MIPFSKYTELAEAKDKRSNHKPVDLNILKKSGFDEYSHGPGHTGYIHHKGSDKTINDVHDHMQKAGYRHTKKISDPLQDGSSNTYIYHKNAGPSADHHVDITTKKGKVWNINHKTVQDLS